MVVVDGWMDGWVVVVVMVMVNELIRLPFQ
jgi:hypothetical protein